MAPQLAGKLGQSGWTGFDLGGERQGDQRVRCQQVEGRAPVGRSGQGGFKRPRAAAANRSGVVGDSTSPTNLDAR